MDPNGSNEEIPEPETIIIILSWDGSQSTRRVRPLIVRKYANKK
jgi:hypothetical protein